jgi:hypothetical protein
MAPRCGSPTPPRRLLCLLANTSDGKPHLNKSLIVVPTKSKGISFSEEAEQTGHALLRYRAGLL